MIYEVLPSPRNTRLDLKVRAFPDAKIWGSRAVHAILVSLGYQGGTTGVHLLGQVECQLAGSTGTIFWDPEVARW